MNAAVGERWASIPERLVRLSPFYMDRYEVTVGRVNDAVARGFVLEDLEYVPRGSFLACTYTSDGSTDALPMNCITKEFAEDFCAFDGGRALPTEAQWEYAATSAGRETLYVWGDRQPTCNDAVFARIGRELSPVFGIRNDDALGSLGQCAELGEGPQEGGSAPIDTTFQGVFDMNGNLQEWTRDSFVALTHECWAQGFLEDPVCDIGGDEYITKGGIWSAPLGALPLPLRRGTTRDASRGIGGFEGHATGFRCVRAAE